MSQEVGTRAPQWRRGPAQYCGGGTEFAVYCGSVWLHATATNKQGNNARLRFHIFMVLMVFSLGVTTLL